MNELSKKISGIQLKLEKSSSDSLQKSYTFHTNDLQSYQKH